MRAGIILSGAAHAALIALAAFGVPWMKTRETPPIRVTGVTFVTEAEFAAAQRATSPEPPPAETVEPDAAPAPPAPVVAPPPEPPAPRAEAPAPPEPEPAPPASLAPGFNPDAPLAAPQEPSLAAPPPSAFVPTPLAEAGPPRPRPAPRVAPAPVPPAPVETAEAEQSVPETALAPAAPPEPSEPPQAPPEAAPPLPAETPAPPPEAEPSRALLAVAPPLPRRGNVAPRPAPQPDSDDAILAEIEREVAREIERQVAAQATPPTPATPATPPATTAPTAGTGSGLPVGPPLTAGEKDGLRLAVQACWNVPAGLREANELKVTVGAELSPTGEVIASSIRLVEPANPPDGRFQQAFEAGRRALIRCSPYGDLPRDKYAQWRNIEVVFNPEGMVSW